LSDLSFLPFYSKFFDFTFYTAETYDWSQLFSEKAIISNDPLRFNELYFGMAVPYVTTYLFFNSFSIDEFNIN
jgi:hypothetical protein